MTIFRFFPFSSNQLPKAAANLTTSSGVKLSPGFPPIVPRIPEILLINATFSRFSKYKNNGLTPISLTLSLFTFAMTEAVR
jgi:hypothetical protein